MNPKHNLKSYLFILATLVLIDIPGYFCQNQQYETCRQSFQCGSMPDLHYPFYGGTNRPAACGYPGFELDCRAEVPLLSISSIQYQVLEINNITQTIRVARQDLWDNLCPQFLRNTTLNFRIMDFYSDSNDQNITLYYGCPANQAQFPRRFSCSVNSTQSTGLYLTEEEQTVAGVNYGCNNNVFVPVNQAAAMAIPTATSVNVLQDALASGFWIQWSANNSNCEDCVGSGGVCGYEVDTASFACYCGDRPYALTCNDSRNAGDSSKRLGMSIGFPIAGAVLAGVGLGWLIFYCKQRRKRQLAARSSQNASKEITPPPSSKAPSTLPPSTASTKSIPSFPSSNSGFRDSTYFGTQVFSYEELEEATENFDDSRVLGEGGFGKVYYGVLSDGRIVAVKRLYENNFKQVEQFMNELQILTRLRHANLVTVYGCTSKRSRDLLLVYEYIPNGTVADHLHGKRAKSGLLSWPVRLNIAIETAKALAYLHQSDIIHRDIKTNNILLDNDFHVKVADFGLSRLFPTDVTHVSTAPQGTPGYVDPEYYQCYQLTEKSDVYSFGVVLMELVSSLQAVDTNRHRQDINLSSMAIQKIQNSKLHELVDQSLGFEESGVVRRKVTLVAELAFRCLQQEREMRPSMEEVVEALKGIENEYLNAHRAVEIVDILGEEDAALLKGSDDTLSPDSVVTHRWASESDPNSIV